MTVLLCPGQGAQFPGMGRDVAERFPESAAIFERADAALDLGLTRIVFDGSAEDVERTDICQPGILTVSIAIWEAAAARGVVDPSQLSAALGLSLGEYTAHVVAGSLEFEDAVRLVRRRGRYMQEASDATPSGMAAVMGPSVDEIEGVCASIRNDGGIVVVANLNAPGQVVISGENVALATCCSRLDELGARRVVPLKVAGAFHSPVMQTAADQLAADLADVTFAAPRVPVVSNVTGAPVTTADEARETLARQVVAPVLFERSLRRVLADAEGTPDFVEPGPGKTLGGFLRKIDRGIRARALETADSIEGAAS